MPIHSLLESAKRTLVIHSEEHSISKLFIDELFIIFSDLNFKERMESIHLFIHLFIHSFIYSFIQ